MKILFEGNNLTNTEAEEIFDNFITPDFTLLENIETKDGDYAIFSNKKILLKAETNCNPDTELNYLRIVDIEQNNVDEELLKFKILSTKKNEELIITHNQIITIIEALEVYKDTLSNANTTSVVARARVNFELNKMEVIKQYLEQLTNYNHQTACINCYNNRLKKNDMMGLGESGFDQSARKKSKKE
jgi:hypothetical protein